MNKTKIASIIMRLWAVISLMLLVGSCANTQDSLTPAESSSVKDSVHQMLESVAKAISHDGPLAWLGYFEKTPKFFMAADGQLVFPDNDAATNFLKNIYSKSVTKIELRWKDIRVDAFSTTIAEIGAVFHEDITDTAGRISPSDGYFTGIAEQTALGWQLRNAHWSIIDTRDKSATGK